MDSTAPTQYPTHGFEKEMTTYSIDTSVLFIQYKYLRSQYAGGVPRGPYLDYQSV